MGTSQNSLDIVPQDPSVKGVNHSTTKRDANAEMERKTCGQELVTWC